jgi:hypothetical protein
MFQVPVLAMMLGGLLLLIGVVGGGFEVKELKIPKVATFPRLISSAFGLMLLFVGLRQERVGMGGTTPLAGAGSPTDVAAAFVPNTTSPAQPAANLGLTESQPVSSTTSQPVVDEHREMVLAQLEIATMYWEDEGFHSLASDDGALAEAGEERFTINVTGGREYVVSAFCDDDCSDIDLVMKDSRDNLVDEDLEVDATPIVTGVPGVSGTYSLTVRVVTCTVEPCRFAVGVFER